MRESTDQKPPTRSRGSKILKFLPKATSFSVPNPPYSPGREKGHNRGFSGPMISIVPEEARRNPAGRGGYQTPEPTSPKVSCIGQIKHKKKVAAAASRARVVPPPSRAPEKKPRFAIGRLFGAGKGRRGETRAEKPPLPPARAAAAAPDPAPALGQLRRFASGRDALANFDWRTSRVADEAGEEQYFYEEDSDDEVFIPHSAPMLVGGGGHVAVEPKKEVNLWKRRTMAPPRPLHLQ